MAAKPRRLVPLRRLELFLAIERLFDFRAGDRRRDLDELFRLAMNVLLCWFSTVQLLCH